MADTVCLGFVSAKLHGIMCERLLVSPRELGRHSMSSSEDATKRMTVATLDDSQSPGPRLAKS